MKKNILYRFIVLFILFFIVITSLGCYVLEYIYDRHPGVGNFITFTIVGVFAAMDEQDQQDSDDDFKGTRKSWWEIYTDATLELLHRLFDYPEEKNIKVVGTNKDFKPIEPQPISSSITFSAMQGVDTGSISISEEDMEKVVEGIEGENGSITLKGNIESPFELSPLTLTIDSATGILTGSFSGSYEYEGTTAGEYYSDSPDTANGIADIRGKVDLITGVITGSGAIVYTWKNAGGGDSWALTIEGTFSPDNKSAKGNIIVEGEVWAWTASGQ